MHRMVSLNNRFLSQEIEGSIVEPAEGDIEIDKVSNEMDGLQQNAVVEYQ